MMLDANDLADGQSLSADLCIIGAGAAGISMALQLVDAGIDVLLLESGGERPEVESQALYAGSVADSRMHSPLDRYRQRRFGGSTTIWGGRCMPLDPVDFEPRSYMPASGWPIGFDDLAPFYPQANQLCEAGACAYTVETAFDRPVRPMIDGFASTVFSTNTLERFSIPTDFGERYRHKLRAARQIRVLLHANVTALRLDSATRTIRSASVATLGGKRIEVKARRFVLASGGLESVRLLLASRDVEPNGIGNAHDLVGRYYMCHIAGTIGSLAFAPPRERVWHGYDISDDGVYCRRRIALSADAQRTFGIGNFVARLHHPRITDPGHGVGILSLLNLAQSFVPYEYGRRLHGNEAMGFANWMRHVGNVIAQPLPTSAFLWHWLRARTFAERKFPSIVVQPRSNVYSLDFHAEQQPDAESRVTLNRETDALGMPRLHVHWRYGRGDVDTVQKALALFADELARSGTGRFAYDADQVEDEMTRYGAYGGHHIGTTRMGTDPHTSVVDADCRVHDVENLFIAGSSVFPTSSQANPTLTIVALSLRLATHLTSLFQRPAEPPTGIDLEPLTRRTTQAA